MTHPCRLCPQLFIGHVSAQLLHSFRDDGHRMVYTGDIGILHSCAFAASFHIVERAFESTVLVYDLLQVTGLLNSIAVSTVPV